MNTTRYILPGLLLSVLSACLVAAPRDYGEGLLNQSPAKLLRNGQQQHAHWSGVGRIRNETQALCTASLLDTRDVSG